jgi:hypothetical protein
MAERTTVRLPEDVLNPARRKTAAEGRALTALIADGLRLIISENREAEKESLSCLGSAKPAAGSCRGST